MNARTELCKSSRSWCHAGAYRPLSSTPLFHAMRAGPWTANNIENNIIIKICWVQDFEGWIFLLCLARRLQIESLESRGRRPRSLRLERRQRRHKHHCHISQQKIRYACQLKATNHSRSSGVCQPSWQVSYAREMMGVICDGWSGSCLPLPPPSISALAMLSWNCQICDLF